MFTNVALKCLTPFYDNNKTTSYPTTTLLSQNSCATNYDDNDITILAYNVFSLPPHDIAGGATHRPIDRTIADSGATQIFVIKGTLVVNRRPMSMPLKVALVDGRHVMSMHMCDISIAGLHTVLTGHIIPNLSIASLFGIRVLTEAGCNVTFTKGECVVRYDGNVILRGTKDPTTNLWTLPLGSPAHHTSHTCEQRAASAAAMIATSPQTQVAAFAHTFRT